MQFAVLGVSNKDLHDDSMADGLLFEAGAYDSGGPWSGTFQVDFARQYGMQNGDLQQVHLVAHFRPAALDEIRAAVRTVSCPGQAPETHPPGCEGLCSYDVDQLVGTPCKIVAGGTGSGRLRDYSVWSWDTGGDPGTVLRRAWISFVDHSPVLRAALVSKQLLGYDVWQESAG